MSGNSARAVLSLDGDWAYRRDPDRNGEAERLFDLGLSRDDWGTMRIPVNWYNTEVGDYHGVIWFARQFELPEDMKGRHYVLRFNAVDYIADVWLNGAYLGRHEGFFAPCQFKVTNHIKAGLNELVVKVDSPRDPTEYRLVPDPPGMERPFSDEYRIIRPVALTIIKGSLIDFYHRPGWETQFGQDCNTGGIWQSVELIATGSLTLDNVRIYPKLVERDGVPDGTALLAVDVDAYNATGGTVEAVVGLEASGLNFESTEELKKSKSFVLTPGSNRLKLVQTVQEPALWWCWDHGDPNLYEMKVTVTTDTAQDEVTEVFGIRELELDDSGHWHLNGKRLFARGMRYHSSIWLAEADERQFREDLNKMRDVHINAIRIGSHVERPEFYRLCDEMGFMVWQVFPMHWGNYADTDDVIERAAPMMQDMVRTLYNHPSVVMWSVFKEPKVYPFEPAPNLYGRLCQILYEAAADVDPIRWVHKGDYEEGVQNVMTGLWGEKLADFREIDNGSPQKVEYGTASLCPVETAREILKPEEQWPPDWDRWHYLNLDPNWLKLQGIDVEAMGSLEELIEASQVWGARQIKESVEYIRQRKYDPNASMFLYFWSDPWPCLSGSGLLDYYRREYKAYGIFGMVYSPVLVSVEWVKDKHVVGFEKVYRPGEEFVAKVWVTSDLDEPLPDVGLTWRIAWPDGAVTVQGERELSIPADSSQVVDEVRWVTPEDVEGLCRMEAEVKSGSGEVLSQNYFEFRVTPGEG